MIKFLSHFYSFLITSSFFFFFVYVGQLQKKQNGGFLSSQWSTTWWLFTSTRRWPWERGLGFWPTGAVGRDIRYRDDGIYDGLFPLSLWLCLPLILLSGHALFAQASAPSGWHRLYCFHRNAGARSDLPATTRAPAGLACGLGQTACTGQYVPNFNCCLLCVVDVNAMWCFQLEDLKEEVTELRKQKAELERELDVQSTETQKQVQKLFHSKISDNSLPRCLRTLRIRSHFNLYTMQHYWEHSLNITVCLFSAVSASVSSADIWSAPSRHTKIF